MVVGACQTFQNDDYLCTTSQVSEPLKIFSDVASVKPVDEVNNTKCPYATVSTSQSEQNENEAFIERRPMGDGRKTIYMY